METTNRTIRQMLREDHFSRIMWVVPKEHREYIIGKNFFNVRVVLHFMWVWSVINCVAMHFLRIYGSKPEFYLSRFKYFLRYGGMAFVFLIIWAVIDKKQVKNYVYKSVIMYTALLYGTAQCIFAFFHYSSIYGFVAYASVTLTTLLFFVTAPLFFFLFSVLPMAIMLIGLHQMKDVATACNVVIYAGLMLALSIFQLSRQVQEIESRRELAEAAAAAKAADAAKSAFLANMSHEIRTPINAVIGMDEMILREEDINNHVREYAINIQSASKNLLSTINDILDFSKIESGKMEITNTEYDIGSLLNDCFNLLYFRAEKKKLQLYVVNNPKLPRHLFGDEIHIRQLVTNILTNAVKYTDYGFVELNVDFVWTKEEEKELELIIAVKDSGIGISEEDMEHLYQSFQRVNLEKNRTTEGSGLGLSITKELIGLMGGSIDVDSKYMLGSKFTLHIPQKAVDEDCMGDFYQTALRQTDAYKVYKPKFKAPDCRILVTDDTKMNTEVVVGLLKQTELAVDIALSGKEAIQKVRKYKYDLIFMDHLMPEMDGVETFHKMQEEFGDDLPPVIALTANAISGSREFYLREGFADYLSKPIEASRLERMLLERLPSERVSVTKDDAEKEKKDGIDAEKEEDESLTNGYSNDPLLNKLQTITLLRVKEGIAVSGSEDVYKNVVKQFYDTAENKVDLIRSCYEKGDWENFRVEVHALKSSARLVGALHLSAVAAKLESFAKEADMDSIEKLYPVVMSDYSNLLEELRGAFTVDTSNLPEISEGDLKAALKMLSEHAQMFDFDTVDSIMDRLEKYRLPEEFAPCYKKLKNYVADVDGDAIKKLVEEEIGDK